MPVFEVNSPIETADPIVVVSAKERPLAPGRYRFRLQVVDDDGIPSDPSFVEVIIRDDRKPTAVLDAPPQVLYGQEFELRGDRSSDPEPGTIKSYIWTLVGRV
ncbi:MAG: hypothetical protein OHK0022_05640 [Roseiflexaceae bacterium]